MKVLKVNGEQYKADVVVKTSIIVEGNVVGHNIIGYIGNAEQFKFGGISDLSGYKLGDEEGNTVEYDISEEEKNQNTINSLGSQLFEAQTKLLESENDKITLGQQLFSLQTQLMTKGVL